MLILGMSCTKDKMAWVVLSGDNRQNATLVVQRQASPPAGAPRGDDLVWVRKEVLAILDSHQVDGAVIKVAEKGRPGTAVSPGRCEVEGVVQEALASRNVPTERAIAVSIRGSFGAKNGAQLQETLKGMPVLTGVAASRVEPFISALTAFASDT